VHLRAYRPLSTSPEMGLHLGLVALSVLVTQLPDAVVPHGVNAPAEKAQAVMVDCGSTKTYPHVYEWDEDRPFTIQEIPAKCKIEPGIASLASTPAWNMTAAVAEYLQPLPACLANVTRRGTTIRFFATGGMRNVPSATAELLWSTLTEWINENTEFSLEVGDAMTISGNLEGVYAMLNLENALGMADNKSAVNFDRDFLFRQQAAAGPEPRRTFGRLSHHRGTTSYVGILDMGGASFQMASTPPAQVTLLQDAYEVILPTQQVTASVYSTSYQLFGQDSALRRYVSTLQREGTLLQAPCFNTGFAQTMLNASGMEVLVKGSGDYEQCRSQVESLLGLTYECLTEPCAMMGRYQPSPSGQKLYAGATFYYTVNGMKERDYVEKDGAYTPTPLQIADAGRKQCALDYSSMIAKDKYSKNYCFASAYIGRVLAAMGIPSNSSQVTYTQVLPPGGNVDFDWARGAQLFINSHELLALLPKLPSASPPPPNQARGGWQSRAADVR